MEVQEHSNPWCSKMRINGVFVQFNDDYDANVCRNIKIQRNSRNNKHSRLPRWILFKNTKNGMNSFSKWFEWNDLYNVGIYKKRFINQYRVSNLFFLFLKDEETWSLKSDLCKVLRLFFAYDSWWPLWMKWC